VPTPLIASSVLSAHLVASAGSEPQRSGWLRDLAEGRRVATLSVLEPGSRDEWEPARLTVRRDGTHVVCTGAKMLVPFASSADLLLVVGRSVHGPTVVAVDPNAPGVSVRRQHDAGGEPVYEVRLDGVLVPETDVVGGFGGAMATLSAALDRATVAAIAYAVGGARRALEMTVEHAKTREQFGRPIGSFQAVAHRCVDMLADIDACELLCLQAAWCIDHRQSAEFEVAAAKAYATDGIRRIYANAHQVHGAIGLSMEHDLQLYSRRGKVFELTYGGASLHRERVARALGLDAG
jgi:alkylation response protein AidB-like acyl-CoA dehydrogenase